MKSKNNLIKKRLSWKDEFEKYIKDKSISLCQRWHVWQISFVIPERILALVNTNPLIADLHITDIGYYPQAHHHFRERPNGSHDQLILIYCVGGQGEIRIKEAVQTISSDQFFIIPAGMPHSYRSDVQNPWSIYWIHRCCR